MNWSSPVSSAVLFVAYITTSCVGLYLIKAAGDWRTATFMYGLVLYALGAALWMVILRLLSLSFAFPIAAGALVVGTMLTGFFFLGEHISTQQVGGAILIVSGIALIAISR
jgi:multidrug transporter EmrE-like cation transporter